MDSLRAQTFIRPHFRDVGRPSTNGSWSWLLEPLRDILSALLCRGRLNLPLDSGVEFSLLLALGVLMTARSGRHRRAVSRA